ncbi:MAG: glycosyltransferase [Candidatus Pacebacteria bacterium]|nr:glycosyltransferase [Candidatus Paceibacterota bacterium]
MTICILANAQINQATLSGGGRIIMELTRRWADKEKVFLYSSNLGLRSWQQRGINNVESVEIMRASDNEPIWRAYFCRTLKGILALNQLKTKPGDIWYSASDFWPNSLPVGWLKWRHKEIKWVAGFYLFAPPPWQKDSPYRGKRFLVGLFYFLTQLPVYWLVKRWADLVFVTSLPDVEKFLTKQRDRSKILVIRGGVDLAAARRYLKSDKIIPLSKRKYDAVFVGRFHDQKGVLELVNIWRLVYQQKPRARLAMIGNGPFEEAVRKKIIKLGLGKNVDLLGFKDGEAKYEIFKQSQIVLHPATYDSGGMAACEAMAWGLPGVSFDLEALKTYYPQGMLKVPCFDLEKFAVCILKLLNNQKLYQKTSQAALEWAEKWDWNHRAANIHKLLTDISGVSKRKGKETAE